MHRAQSGRWSQSLQKYRAAGLIAGLKTRRASHVSHIGLGLLFKGKSLKSMSTQLSPFFVDRSEGAGMTALRELAGIGQDDFCISIMSGLMTSTSTAEVSGSS